MDQAAAAAAAAAKLPDSGTVRKTGMDQPQNDGQYCAKGCLELTLLLYVNGVAWSKGV